MQELEELLAQMADARKIYRNEPVAPYHGDNRAFEFEHDLMHNGTGAVLAERRAPRSRN